MYKTMKKTNVLTKKILVSAVTVLVLACIGYFGYSAYKSNQMEKKFEARVNQGVELYNKIKEANKIIEQQHQKYINEMSEAVDRGTYTEDAETQAFNSMYEAIDREINAFHFDVLCDSLNKLRLSEYDFTPDYSDKIDKLETLMTKLNNCGYAVNGFSTRSDKWKNDPWYSLNTPTYHSFRQIADYADELEAIGAELNEFSPDIVTQPNNKSNGIDEIVDQAIKYYNGNGTQRNADKAIELFTKAANSGHAHSMYNLGVIFEDSDAKKAHDWYCKAAINGDTEAMIELAQNSYNMLNSSHRQKSQQDKQLAKKWYDRAANYGNTTGLYHMGLYYYLWGEDNVLNNTIAEKYFQIGSISGDAHCTNCYASLQKDPETQAQYYMLALKQDPDYEPARENLRKLGY